MAARMSPLVVRNSMAYPQTLRKKIPVARAVAASHVGNRAHLCSPELHNAGDRGRHKASQRPKMTMGSKGRGNYCLRSWIWVDWNQWPPELADSAWSLLGWVPWHLLPRTQQTWLYSLSTEHVTKATDNDAPFREWFRWIPPPLVEEGHVHTGEKYWIKVHDLHLSQSVWCNAVMLVWTEGQEVYAFLYRFLPPQPLHEERLSTHCWGSRRCIGESG